MVAHRAVGSRRSVMNGNSQHTSGGLGKARLMKVKVGEYRGKALYRIVSRRKHNAAKRPNSPLHKWVLAVRMAKNKLGIRRDAFVKVKKGGRLYAEAKRIYRAM